MFVKYFEYYKTNEVDDAAPSSLSGNLRHKMTYRSFYYFCYYFTIYFFLLLLFFYYLATPASPAIFPE